MSISKSAKTSAFKSVLLKTYFICPQLPTVSVNYVNSPRGTVKDGYIMYSISSRVTGPVISVWTQGSGF